MWKRNLHILIFLIQVNSISKWFLTMAKLNGRVLFITISLEEQLKWTVTVSMLFISYLIVNQLHHVLLWDNLFLRKKSQDFHIRQQFGFMVADTRIKNNEKHSRRLDPAENEHWKYANNPLGGYDDLARVRNIIIEVNLHYFDLAS